MGSNNGRLQVAPPSDSSSESGATSHGAREGLNIPQCQRESQGEVRAQGKSCGYYATTIDTLTDNILLDIFDSCGADELPYRQVLKTWKWARLVQVCRRWRQLIFASPLRLRIQLLCTPGTPVRKYLRFWPDFPIIVNYNYKRLARKEEDNVFAALENPSRVCALDLDVTTRQFVKLVSVMQESCPVLKYLGLTLHRNTRRALVLPGGFLGGSAPSLQALSFDSVPFPALPTLLLSARYLVTLELCRIPPTGYISPEAMVMGLATSTSLERLVIAFQSTVSHPDGIRLPPVPRAVLPALITFDFTGVSDYLEDLVARIDCPKLKWLKIFYLHRYVGFRVFQLSEFINRLEDPRLRQFRSLDACFCFESGIRLDVHHSYYDIMISLSFCGTEWGVSHVIQVFRQFSSRLSDVRHLSIACLRPGIEIDQHKWVQLLRPFTTVQTLHLETGWQDYDRPALEDVVEEGVTEAEILPALGLIFFDFPRVPLSALKFFENLVAVRRLSSRPVTAATCKWEFNKGKRSYFRNRDYQLHSPYSSGINTFLCRVSSHPERVLG